MKKIIMFLKTLLFGDGTVLSVVKKLNKVIDKLQAVAEAQAARAEAQAEAARLAAEAATTARAEAAKAGKVRENLKTLLAIDE